MDAPSERRSQRGTKGRPPSRYGEWVGPASESVSVPSGVSGSSRLSRAAFQRKLAETNLAAAEKIVVLDPASSATYISQHVADQVGLKSAPRQLHAAVIGGKSVSVNSQKVQTKLSSVDGNTECQVDA